MFVLSVIYRGEREILGVSTDPETLKMFAQAQSEGPITWVLNSADPARNDWYGEEKPTDALPPKALFEYYVVEYPYIPEEGVPAVLTIADALQINKDRWQEEAKKDDPDIKFMSTHSPTTGKCARVNVRKSKGEN